MASLYKLDGAWPLAVENQTIVNVRFKSGVIGMLESDFQEEHIAILREFSEELSLGFTRFLDIQRVDEAQRKLIEEMESELLMARDLQLGLMPVDAPRIEGIDFSGRCIPATQVGGDFYQYFHLESGKLVVVLADVSGHAMGAAIPVVMFSGVLRSEVKHQVQITELMRSLNQTMCESLKDLTFVCVEVLELEISTGKLRVSNGGCPYPYHYKAHDACVLELQVGAYPLGVRPTTQYEVLETSLDSGDYVIMCSDGIIEAENSAGEQFGYERTAETVQTHCRKGSSADSIVDDILRTVDEFRGDASQSDDMTCVALAWT